MIDSNKKVVRMTTSGMKKANFKNRQQAVKTHEVLTKNAYGKGGKQHYIGYKR